MSAPVDVLAVTKQVAEIEKARARLQKARDDYAKLKGLGGQQGYAVSINGVSVRVAEMDQFYAPKLIRGREMLHLGALKVLAAEIDRAQHDVAMAEQALAALARCGATP